MSAERPKDLVVRISLCASSVLSEGDLLHALSGVPHTDQPRLTTHTSKSGQRFVVEASDSEPTIDIRLEDEDS